MSSQRVTWCVIGVVIAVTAVACFALAASEPTGRCVEVVDGDTLRVELADGAVSVVHLFGIDAPELGQPDGDEAVALIAEAVGDEVQLAVRARAGEQLVATVTCAGHDLAHRLVEAGYAWLAEEGATDERYAEALFIARASQQGLWAGESPVHPAKWRREHTVRPTPTPSGLSHLAANIDLETGPDGKARIDISDIPSMYARNAEARLFAARLVQISEVKRWLVTARQIDRVYCSGVDASGEEGSVWSDELGAWVGGERLPRECAELQRQIGDAEGWIADAKRVTMHEAERGGLSKDDLETVATAFGVNNN